MSRDPDGSDAREARRLGLSEEEFRTIRRHGPTGDVERELRRARTASERPADGARSAGSPSGFLEAVVFLAWFGLLYVVLWPSLGARFESFLQLLPLFFLVVIAAFLAHACIGLIRRLFWRS